MPNKTPQRKPNKAMTGEQLLNKAATGKPDRPRKLNALEQLHRDATHKKQSKRS